MAEGSCLTAFPPARQRTRSMRPGISIMGIMAGIYYWFPKMTGRFLDEGLGKLNFWLMFIGINLTFFPMHFLGVAGMPRRIYTYDSGMGWDTWNMVATIGSYTIAVGLLVHLTEYTAGRIPWLGRLPGDIIIKRGNFTFYFPLATSRPTRTWPKAPATTMCGCR